MNRRAIDLYEYLIVEVLDRTDTDAVTLAQACRTVADRTDVGMTAERLEHLSRVWCAVAGLEVPA